MSLYNRAVQLTWWLVCLACAQVCSYNKLRFENSINKVYGPIDFPCQGSWPTKGKYDITKSCADPELYGAWDAAKDYLKKVRIRFVMACVGCVLREAAVACLLALYRQ